MPKLKKNTGTLNQVLAKIASQLSLDAHQLKQAASQAPYAANREGGKPWPSGTGSENEKRIVYALVYVMQCVDIVDLGTSWGAMATQLASATKDNGILGQVYSIDNQSNIGGTGHKTGKLIPGGLSVEMIRNDAVKWLSQRPDNQFDVIFEDTAHTAEITHAVYEQAKKKLDPGSIIISHDVCFPRWRDAIAKGFELAGVAPELYLVDGDGCGLSIWQKPQLTLNPYISSEYKEALDAIPAKEYEEMVSGTFHLPEDDPPKPKRKRKRKSKEPNIED